MKKLRPTRTRDYTMKKIFMFMLIACLVGGFANSANAQHKRKKSSTPISASSTPSVVSSIPTSGVTDAILGQFESAVKTYVDYYSYTPQRNFDLGTYSQYYDNANEFKGKLEKIKAGFSSSQLGRFNTAVTTMSDYPTPDEVQREKAAKAENSGKKNKPKEAVLNSQQKPQH